MEDFDPLLTPIDSNHHIEIAYVAHICLSWEALHCQYTQLNHLISCQPQNSTTHYNLTAQLFQQFQVLLQRFIENEPFQQALRPTIYARTRRTFPKMLHVPNIQGIVNTQTPPNLFRIPCIWSTLFLFLVQLQIQTGCRNRNLIPSSSLLTCCSLWRLQSLLSTASWRWRRKLQILLLYHFGTTPRMLLCLLVFDLLLTRYEIQVYLNSLKCQMWQYQLNHT